MVLSQKQLSEIVSKYVGDSLNEAWYDAVGSYAKTLGKGIKNAFKDANSVRKDDKGQAEADRIFGQLQSARAKYEELKKQGYFADGDTSKPQGNQQGQETGAEQQNGGQQSETPTANNPAAGQMNDMFGGQASSGRGPQTQAATTKPPTDNSRQQNIDFNAANKPGAGQMNDMFGGQASSGRGPQAPAGSATPVPVDNSRQQNIDFDSAKPGTQRDLFAGQNIPTQTGLATTGSQRKPARKSNATQSEIDFDAGDGVQRRTRTKTTSPNATAPDTGRKKIVPKLGSTNLNPSKTAKKTK